MRYQTASTTALAGRIDPEAVVFFVSLLSSLDVHDGLAAAVYLKGFIPKLS
jgi:hypothetical protein